MERVGDRYALIRPLGSGGMGEVFLAHDAVTGSECALKRLRAGAVSDRAALAREFAHLAGIRHPAVVRVLDFGYAPDGAAWYTMEYVPGASAADVAPLRGESLAFVASQLAHGLEALHHAGTLHGDLKPSNVLVLPPVDDSDRPAGVRIVDFGLASLTHEAGPRFAGSVGFAAPETVQGGARGPASDLYGLGATLYTLATGRMAFEGDTSSDRLRRQSEGHASAGPLEAAGVAPALASLVLRLLSREPSRRPESARDVRLELERILPGARRPLAERLGSFALVGRERELARLDAWIDAGEASVLTLIGEPGIGRTSLLDAFASRQALAQRPVVRLGAGDERAIDEALALGASHGAKDVRPLLIVDDAQRLPAAAMERLRRLALDPESMLRMLWSRPSVAAISEEERVLAYSGRLARLRLEPLDRAGVERLVAVRLGAPAPRELVDRLIEGASGHPGLTVELLRAGAAAGALVEDDDGIRVDVARLSALRLPGAFGAAQRTRLHAVPVAARDVALALAVCGAVPRAALARLVPESTAEDADALLESGLARADGGGSLRLSYASLGEALIADAEPDRVSALHRAALEALELAPAARLEHMAGGGDAEGALREAEPWWERSPGQVPVALVAGIAERHAVPSADLWLERAAETARGRGRYADCATLLERSIARTRDPGLLADRRERLAFALYRAGRLDEVEPAIAAARSCDPGARVRARLCGLEASRRFAIGRMDEALAIARDAIAACDAAGDPEGAGNAALTAGSALLRLDRLDDAGAMARLARSRYVACEHAVGQSRALQLDGLVLRQQGRTEAAESAFREALERAEASGSRLAIEEAHLRLGQLATDRGRWRDTREEYRHALRLALEDGRGTSAAHATLNLAIVEGLAGTPVEAARLARRALRLARSFYPSWVFDAHRARSIGLRGMGRVAEAQAEIEKAIGLGLRGGGLESLAWCRVEHVRVLLEREQHRQALAAAAQDQAEAEWTPGHAILELLAGRAALRVDDRTRAAQALRAYRTWEKGHAHPYAAAIATQLRAELSLCEGRVDEAVEHLNEALAGFDALPAPHDRATALLDAARLASQPRFDHRSPVGDWLRQAVTAFGMLGNRWRRAQAVELENEWLRHELDQGMVEVDRGLVEKVGGLLHVLSNDEELAQRAMELAVEHFDAERGVLLIRDADTGAMTAIAQHGAADATSAEQALRFSRGMVRRVVKEARTIVVYDAPQDALAATPSVEELRIRALLCTPMFLHGRVVGAVYLDSRRPGAFGITDRRLLQGFAMYMAQAFEESRIAQRMAIENRELRREMRRRASAGLVGSSAPLRRVIEMVERVSRNRSIVLLTGETGTGKGLIAELIHKAGPRAQGPFVAVNCGAISKDLIESELFGVRGGAATGVTHAEGCFRAADGGTLFLDEIAELPGAQQTKLLKVLDEGKVAAVGKIAEPVSVDVRIIAATNQDLRRLVSRRKFRSDLFHRLDVLRIHLPPLRERMADIPDLAAHFVAQFAARDHRPVPKMAPEFLARIMARDWPGNVRELKNYVERRYVESDGKVLHAGSIGKRPTPRRPTSGTRKLKEDAQAFERARIEQALRRAGGNQSKAARDLGLKESTFRAKLKKHRIQSRRKLRFS